MQLRERKYVLTLDIRLELREMHQMLIKEDLLPDLNEAKEIISQLDALLDLLSEKKVTKIKSQF